MFVRTGVVRAVLAGTCSVLLVAGCTRGASTEELEAAKQEALQQAQEEQRLKELEERLDRLREESEKNKAAAKKAQRRAAEAERKAAQNNNNNGGGGGGGGLSGPVTACGDGVYAGANTSCAFAMNVAGEYGSNYGASTITAYSPVTGQTYTMSCYGWSGGGHVCTGGNNASVYLP